MAEYSLSLDQQKIETIEKRKTVLLDINVWIELADGKTTQATKLRDRLLRLHSNERILCPLVAPTIWELRKQSSPSLEHTAELMEVLSLNVSFRGLNQIFDKEIDHFLEYLRTDHFSPLSTSDKYGSLLSYLVPKFKLGSDQDRQSYKQQRLCENLAGITKNISLTQLISLLGAHSFPNVDTARGYQAASRSLREAMGSVTKIRRVEIENIAQTIIIPKLNAKRSKLPIQEQLIVMQRVKKLPQNKKYGSSIEHILKFMPALSAYIEMLVATGLDTNRKDNPNDFFDREILVYGLSYSTIFASIDSWISSLVNYCRKSKYPGIFAFSGSLSELDQNIDIVENEI